MTVSLIIWDDDDDLSEEKNGLFKIFHDFLTFFNKSQISFFLSSNDNFVVELNTFFSLSVSRLVWLRQCRLWLWLDVVPFSPETRNKKNEWSWATVTWWSESIGVGWKFIFRVAHTHALTTHSHQHTKKNWLENYLELIFL